MRRGEIQHRYHPQRVCSALPSDIFPASFRRVSTLLWALLHFCHLRCSKLTQDVPCRSPESTISQGSPSLPRRGMGFRNQGWSWVSSGLRSASVLQGHSQHPKGIECLRLLPPPSFRIYVWLNHKKLPIFNHFCSKKKKKQIYMVQANIPSSTMRMLIFSHISIFTNILCSKIPSQQRWNYYSNLLITDLLRKFQDLFVVVFVPRI